MDYSVPCPECDQRFSCEFIMQSHQMSHWPQPRAFIDLVSEHAAISPSTDIP